MLLRYIADYVLTQLPTIQQKQELLSLMQNDHQLEFLRMIHAEQERQVKKWGVQTHDPQQWVVILGEEFGEVCRAVYEKKEDNYIEELMQVAAVAASAYIAYQLNKENSRENFDLPVTTGRPLCPADED